MLFQCIFGHRGGGDGGSGGGGGGGHVFHPPKNMGLDPPLGKMIFNLVGAICYNTSKVASGPKRYIHRPKA